MITCVIKAEKVALFSIFNKRKATQSDMCKGIMNVRKLWSFSNNLTQITWSSLILVLLNKQTKRVTEMKIYL